MKLYILILLAFTCFSISYSQERNYNLNFEQEIASSSNEIWKKKNNDVNIRRDTKEKYQGEFSLNIKPTDMSQGLYGVVKEINSTFNGKQITFKGYMKAVDVQSAYFYLIVGTETNQFSFDLTEPISGSTDWKEFKITLPYTSEATKITVAANIEGQGEVWIDDISIQIDGQDINTLEPIDRAEASDSGFILESLSETKTEKLAMLGKLWGFLKYYHPAVSQGNFDWDKELFKILPLADDSDFSTKIEEWVYSLGELEASKETEDTREIKIKPDFDWFQSELISESLRNKLQAIEDAQKPKENYYVSLSEELKSPVFQNEKRYSSINYKDDGMKLLSLFRYWNYIQYFYPYRYLISEEWNKVLKKFIPELVNAKDEREYNLALAGLVSKTEDTHHTLLQNPVLESYLGANKVPASAIFINDTLVVKSSEDIKIKSGDVIQRIDDVPISVLKEKFNDISGASNRTTQLREIAAKVLRTQNKTVELEIWRDNEILDVTVESIPFHTNISNHSFASITEISDEIGYLNTSDLTLEEYDSIFKKWDNKKAIIFDLRTYPKENLARLLPYLHEEPVSFFRSTSGSVDKPGTFAFDEPIFFETKDGYKYKGTVVILINNESQSKSEFSAMALRTAPNSTVIGSQTAGTDGDVVNVVLPGNVRTIMTGNGIYTLDKEETQQVGIIPDIKVENGIQDLTNEKDEILQAAIEAIKQ